MKLNPSKCHFGVKAGKFTGYMVTKRGIETIPKWIREIINLKSTSCTKDIQRLTCIVVNLNKLISKSSKICKPLYNILKKKKRIEWIKTHEEAFHELKKYLSLAPLLVKSLHRELLFLCLAVSTNTTSLILVMDQDGAHHHIYYVSKSFLNAENMYSH